MAVKRSPEEHQKVVNEAMAAFVKRWNAAVADGVRLTHPVLHQDLDGTVEIARAARAESCR